MLMLAGCGKTPQPDAENESVSETEAATSAETTVNAGKIEYKTVEPPEGGWTTEEIMDVTYLCDKQLVYPLSMDDLGEGFSLEHYDRVASRKRLVPAALCYGGKQLANATVVKVDGKRMIYNVVLFPEVCEVENVEPFVINGIKMYDTIEEVEAALGEPNYKSDDALMYDDRETRENLYSLFFEDGKLVHFNNAFRFYIDLPLYNKLREQEG